MAEERPKRCGPFAAIYMPWLAGLAKSGNVEAAVFGALCTALSYDEERNAYSSVPRDWLVTKLQLDAMAYERAAERGEQIDWPEAFNRGRKTAKDVTRRLSNKGLIRLVNHPHNGEAAVYQIMPGMPWPLKTQGPSDGERRIRSGEDDFSSYD